jgi:FKBP-type peptidyl-prolyl cis-trans isomerase FkpA
MAESVNLQIELLRAGDGVVPETGQTVSVHYTGWLTNGTKFDSSVDRNEPFEFVAGEGQVIAGWDMALLRMRVGDQVKVTLPSHLAYGDSGAAGVIPPKATLVFQIELLEVR